MSKRATLLLRILVVSIALFLNGCNTRCHGFTTTTTCSMDTNRLKKTTFLLPRRHPASCSSFGQAVPSANNKIKPASSFSRLFAQIPTQENEEAVVVVERPDPSILLSAQSKEVQRLGFGAIAVGIAAGTALTIRGLTVLEKVLPNGWFAAWRDYTWSLPMGLIFLLVGITHFTFKDTYTAFVPPRGTWGGLWQVPAPGDEKLGITYEEYHCYWTGLAEIGGGLLLILAGFPFYNLPVQLPAALLFGLTVAVTPANIYMATHDIQPPRLPPVPYPAGHIFRGVMQSILLAMFWKLTFQ